MPVCVLCLCVCWLYWCVRTVHLLAFRTHVLIIHVCIVPARTFCARAYCARAYYACVLPLRACCARANHCVCYVLTRTVLVLTVHVRACVRAYCAWRIQVLRGECKYLCDVRHACVLVCERAFRYLCGARAGALCQIYGMDIRRPCVLKIRSAYAVQKTR